MVIDSTNLFPTATATMNKHNATVHQATSEQDVSTIPVTKDQFIYQYEKRRDPYEN